MSRNALFASDFSILNFISWQAGLIDLNEFIERIDVLAWLLSGERNSSDPRTPLLDDSDGEDYHERENAEPIKQSTDFDEDEAGVLELIPQGLGQSWVFTIGDADSYPSVPHGHLEAKEQSWPKLNPYTGRAFRQKHQEETSLRLNKRKMRLLWRNPKFRQHCYEQVQWYIDHHTHYRFSVNNPLRFPKWR